MFAGAQGTTKAIATTPTELIALAPDVIFAFTSPIVLALQHATRSVPIVFAGVIDPVGSGLVASLARPSGNTTGFALFEYAIAAKWLELLKEIAPHVTRTAVLREPQVSASLPPSKRLDRSGWS